MKEFLIIPNGEKDPGYEMTKKIQAYLKEKGATARVFTEEGKVTPDIAGAAEAILVLGGDGTMLRAARATRSLDIPLLGINMGTLGYLAEIEKSQVEYALDMLVSDNFTTEARLMLRGESGGKIYHALNDVAIVRRGSMQMVSFQITVNGQILTTYYADGVLIASPTGSTGYNLSAGGPIVEPSAEILLLTPICPHSMHARSILLSKDDVIQVKILEGRRDRTSEAEACFDGADRVLLGVGDEIEIRRSHRTTDIIKLSKKSFLEVLHKKLNQ